MTRKFQFLTLVLAMVAVSGTACASLVQQPASGSRPVTATSTSVALRAALEAASQTDWVPRTVTEEAGYILAERGARTVGRDAGDTYTLEINLPPNGSGQVRAKVTPPKGRMGGASTDKMVEEFLDAFERALRATS